MLWFCPFFPFPAPAIQKSYPQSLFLPLNPCCSCLSSRFSFSFPHSPPRLLFRGFEGAKNTTKTNPKPKEERPINTKSKQSQSRIKPALKFHIKHL